MAGFDRRDRFEFFGRRRRIGRDLAMSGLAVVYGPLYVPDTVSVAVPFTAT